MTQTSAIFVADAPGLDFLNSVATPADVTIDWLADGAGLVSWLKQSGLVSDETLAEVCGRSAPKKLDETAVAARSLREQFRDFVLARKGRPLDGSALAELAVVNRLLEQDDRHSEIALRRDGSGFERVERRRWRDARSLLAPIAQELAELVCDEDFTFVKQCEGPSCTLLFVDRTRGRARRWCSMALCGNRAKQAAHRERLRAKSASAE